MRRVFLLMVVSALLVTLGLAQTPAASSNTDGATVKGCLGGSDGNYTVAEDGTRLIFKITTSNVDLKAHLGHEVKLIGHKTSGTVSSGTGDNSFAVTELNMISEHCAAAAAATVGAVAPYSQTAIEPTTAAPAPSAPASTPAVDAAAPAATVSPSSAAVSAPAVEAASPATPVSPAPAPASAPAVEAAPPVAPASPAPAAVSAPAVEATPPAAPAGPSSATVSAPAAEAAHAPRPSSHARRLAATKATAAAAPVSPTAETASPAAADAATAKPSSPETVSPAAADAATAGPSSEAASAPAAAAPTPAVTHRAGSLSLLIAFVVLVIVLGTLAPLLFRWRKRKVLERTGAPNLSFTNEVSSDLDQPEPRKVA
jgi:hypothetical protein